MLDEIFSRVVKTEIITTTVIIFLIDLKGFIIKLANFKGFIIKLANFKGFGILSSGFGILSSGFGILSSGLNTLSSGLDTLSSGLDTLSRGLEIFPNGFTIFFLKCTKYFDIYMNQRLLIFYFTIDQLIVVGGDLTKKSYKKRILY